MMSRFSRPGQTAARRPTARAATRQNALILGLFGALGVIAWGCGSGYETRYYCDATNCYDCDAYGCAPVATPTYPACTGNSSCAPGTLCTSNGCTATCSTDAQCRKGETCQAGLCSPPGKTPGTTKECSTKADCGADKTCTGGVCLACGGSNGPCPCTTKDDCSAGQLCIAGACTAQTNTCKYSSECSDSKLCADGQCLAACGPSGTCDAGFVCEKDVCKPVPTTGGTPACTSDTQCTSPDAPNCVSGSCAKACTGDATCGDGKYCNQGACVVDTRPKPNCTSDDQCGGTSATPKKCVGGFCKFVCTPPDDQYCRTIDNRIGYCAKDNVCRSAAEASAACFGPGECPNNQSCIDNKCK